jgi:tRNA threonylcarbamoyladenosine biosynthesis protein TsaE
MATVPLADLPNVARDALARLPQSKETATLVALKGQLGAGKTTFVQTLARELGVTEPVQSPTYVLMKSYQVAYKQLTQLIHIDAYRLESADEFKTLMPETFLRNPHNLVLIEWPERVEGQLPAPDLVIAFSSETARDSERFIEITQP